MIYLQIFMGLFIVLCILYIVSLLKNSRLKKEIKALQGVLEMKDTTISNLEASRVAVKDVLDNFSLTEEVMTEVAAGESRESISEKLGIPVSKIELIIKFDKIKKKKHL